MKHRCYPKSKYISLFLLAILLIVFAVVPYFFTEWSIPIYIKIIWSCLMVILSLSMLYLAIVNFQYFIIVEDEIIVKCLFYEISRLKLSKCEVLVEELPTYSSGGIVNNLKWICLYDIKANPPKFKNGCSNERKAAKIQIIYNNKTENALSHLLKKEKVEI